MLGIFRTIITDIVSDGFTFVAFGQGRKSNKERAEEFARRNFLKEELKASLVDWLMLGNALLWVGGGEQEAKEFKEFYVKHKKNINLKEADLELKQFLDEVETGMREIKHVPWSTVTIHLNENQTGIGFYTQSILGSVSVLNARGTPLGRELIGQGGPVVRRWSPDQVLHARFMQFDGGVYGFTPTFSLLPEISTLQLLKDYAGTFFENGGVPDWMFILPEDEANSPNVRRLEQTLQNYKHPLNKHGNMVLTGQITPTKLNEFNKDMEFRKLAVYYTASLGFTFGLPKGKMQSILGMEMKGQGTDDLADSAYWRNISESQDYWESILNTQFFIPRFKAEIRFNRSYKQDEVRETQVLSQKVPALNDMQNLLRPYKKKLGLSYIQMMLNIKDEELEAGAVEEEIEFGKPNPLSNQQVIGESQQRSRQKRQEQTNKIDSTGIKPLGK